jgi:hypothetical protein
MDFQQWLVTVVESVAIKTKKDITEIYSLIDLTEAKLSYLDDLSPEEYSINLCK